MLDFQEHSGDYSGEVKGFESKLIDGQYIIDLHYVFKLVFK